MQQIDPTDAETHNDTLRQRGGSRSHLRRFWLICATIAVVLSLVLLPPLINISRYQRRIVTSISGSLGRPVHLDRVSISLLPLPGFDIENLVVDEDPAFGYEPIIRANKVHATVRLSSLWRRRVEFSTISFTEPSVNLVSSAAGKWNIEGILLQASHIDTAPTAQAKAGPAPRFPYIEATGARINFKEQQEKKPFSLIESQFALWSPDPNQWRLRLRAKPSRTDSNASDTGTIELETTLGRGETLAGIPINLEGQWRDAPLGEASRVLTGHDAGWRGNLVLSANIRGTVGESAVTSRLHLMGARRADFVPQQPLSAEVECFATATAIFHSFQDVRCSWPPNGNGPTMALTGEVPNIRRLEDASVQIGTSGIPAATLLNWARVVTPGIADGVEATGNLVGSLTYDGATTHHWTGKLTLHDAGLTTTETGAASLVSGDVLLQTPQTAIPDTRYRRNNSASTPAQDGFALSITGLQLGGHDAGVLTGQLNPTAYTLRLQGSATEDRLSQLAHAFPAAAGDLIEAAGSGHASGPFRVDLTSAHAWGEPQLWHDTAARQAQTSALAKKAR